MQKQAKTEKQVKTEKKTVAAKKAVATTQVVKLEEKVLQMLTAAQKADSNIKVQKVTGYTSVKYGNKVLFELHLKRKSITHLTFSDKQAVYKLLEANKLILRVVDASYGWKFNTECLLTNTFMEHFETILKSVIDEAIAERNLKSSKKAVKTA